MAGCAGHLVAQPAASVTALALLGCCCYLRSPRGKRRAGAAGSAATVSFGARCTQCPERQGIPQPVSVDYARARASAIAHRRGACCRRRRVAVWPPALCLSNLNGNRSGFAIAGGVSPLRDVRGTRTTRSLAVSARRRFSWQPQSRQGRVDLPSLRPRPPVLRGVSFSGDRQRGPGFAFEGGRMVRIALADLVLPPGLPCLAGPGASSVLASCPAPGLVKAWCLLLTERFCLVRGPALRFRRDSGPPLVASPPRTAAVLFWPFVVLAPRAAPAVSERWRSSLAPWVRPGTVGTRFHSSATSWLSEPPPHGDCQHRPAIARGRGPGHCPGSAHAPWRAGRGAPACAVSDRPRD